MNREKGPSLRLDPPGRNNSDQERQPKGPTTANDGIWSLDFVAHALFDGRKRRMLPDMDPLARECLAIDVGQSLKGEDVVRLNSIVKSGDLAPDAATLIRFRPSLSGHDLTRALCDELNAHLAERGVVI